MVEANALLVYDMFRCMRCPTLRYAVANDTGSSFLQAIDMLHARWHQTGNLVGIRDVR